MPISVGFRRAFISVCLSPFPWPLGEHRGSLCLPPAVAKGTQNNPVHCLFVSPKAFESQRKREMRKQLKAPSECCTNIFPAQEPVNRDRASKLLHFFSELGIMLELLVFEWTTPHRGLLWGNLAQHACTA